MDSNRPPRANRRILNWLARWPVAIAAIVFTLLWISTLFGDLVLQTGGANIFAASAGSFCIDRNTVRPCAPDTFHWPLPHEVSLGENSSIGWSDSRLMYWNNPGRSLVWVPQFNSNRGQPAVPGLLPTSRWQFFLPFWIPFTLCLIPATLAWRSHLRRNRPGLCPTCRYNLTGLPPNSPCPECGTPSQPRTAP